MLEIINLSKKIDSFELKNINCKIEDGDYFVLMGMSGAGKSVLLETIAGIISPDSGSVVLNNKNISNIKIQKRNIGLVFQNASIFPHKSVFENVAYPLKCKKLSKKEIKIKVEEIAELTSLNDLLYRNPNGLSGGELQRVAIARALALDPDILLLDEPLSSLDVILKAEFRSLLRKINATGLTIIHVTHDYHEAVLLANKVGVIENGELIQIGTAEDVFLYPRSKFAANFVGINNFYKVKVCPESLMNVKIIDHNIFFHLDKQISSDGFIIIPPDSIEILDNDPIILESNTYKAEIIEIVNAIVNLKIKIDIGIILEMDIPKALITFKLDDVPNYIWVRIKSEDLRFVTSFDENEKKSTNE
jgi:ABC-type sugar transport system ATPase subunit